jgi:acetyltransferase
MLAIRSIGPADRDAFQAFVQSMSQETRTNRFFSPVRELSPAILEALTEPDQKRHVGLVAIEGGQIVGEARYVQLGQSGRGEFAIAVTDEWQRQGIGARLLGALQSAARSAGLLFLGGEVLRTNVPMLRFSTHAGFQLKSCPEDARLAMVERSLASAL